MNKLELDQAVAELARALMVRPLTTSQRRIVEGLARAHYAMVTGNQLPAVKRLTDLKLVAVEAVDHKFGCQRIQLAATDLHRCVMAQRVIQ